ncbi:MAG: alpha/beta fold hydrolase [Flavobacteriaceae bacterium]|nr:alpha/beta fold hydrolase [Flavobacteriaceae bacterium]
MKQVKNLLIKGNCIKPIVTDYFYKNNRQQKPIIIFCHGYKGFKDWGCWNLIAEHFAQLGYFFVKFNFSYNGGTPEQPIDFPDLEAFGNNNLSQELDDLNSVLDHVLENNHLQQEINKKKITLIGHSRGGGIVTLKAAQDPRMSSVVSWAGVSDYEDRFPKGKVLDEWRKTGVYFIENSRTKQKMPHYFQFYEDFIANKERLNIQKAVKKITIPHLIIHGTDDAAVPVQEAKNLHAWNPNSELYLLNGASHTFGSKHPWFANSLTFHLQKVMEKTIRFLEK